MQIFEQLHYLLIGRASCHKTLLQMSVLPKVKSFLCADSQLPGDGPTDVEDAIAPAR